MDYVCTNTTAKLDLNVKHMDHKIRIIRIAGPTLDL